MTHEQRLADAARGLRRYLDVLFIVAIGGAGALLLLGAAPWLVVAVFALAFIASLAGGEYYAGKAYRDQ